MKQDIKDLVVFAVAIIVVHEFEELPHLVPRDSLSRHAIVDHYPGKLKGEWVLLQAVIIDRHLESGPEHPPDRFYTAVPLPVSLKFDQEQLGIRGFYVPDLLTTEIFLCQEIPHKLLI